MGKLIKKLPQNYGNPHLTDFDHNLRDQNCLNDLACSNFPPKAYHTSTREGGCDAQKTCNNQHNVLID